MVSCPLTLLHSRDPEVSCHLWVTAGLEFPSPLSEGTLFFPAPQVFLFLEGTHPPNHRISGRKQFSLRIVSARAIATCVPMLLFRGQKLFGIRTFSNSLWKCVGNLPGSHVLNFTAMFLGVVLFSSTLDRHTGGLFKRNTLSSGKLSFFKDIKISVIIYSIL